MNATLSNDRLGIAVILDAANGAGFVDPEVCSSVILHPMCLSKLQFWSLGYSSYFEYGPIRFFAVKCKMTIGSYPKDRDQNCKLMYMPNANYRLILLDRLFSQH